MARYEVLAMDHDSGHSLGVVELAVPPTRGDTIVMTGPEYGSGDNKTGEVGTESFHVIDIIHEVYSGRDDSDTVVHVLSEDHGRDFVPRCTCPLDECMPLTDDTCDNCRGRLSRDRRRGARPVVDKEVDGLIDTYERSCQFLDSSAKKDNAVVVSAALALADHVSKSRR